MRPWRGRSNHVAAPAATTATRIASRQSRTPSLHRPGHCRRHRIAHRPALRRARQPAGSPSRARGRGLESAWTRSGASGDLVGYGAEPDGCVALARERCDLCLAGNHDLVVTGAIDIADFSANAAAAARWTRENIAAESLEFLRGLAPAADETQEIGLYHASPRDPSGNTCSPTWQAGECMNADGPPRGRGRAFARGALLPPQRSDEPWAAPTPPAAPSVDVSDGRVAAQPRRGGPAAGRRQPGAPGSCSTPTRWTADVAPGGVPDRRGRPGDRGGRAAGRSWPSGCMPAQ